MSLRIWMTVALAGALLAFGAPHAGKALAAEAERGLSVVAAEADPAGKNGGDGEAGGPDGAEGEVVADRAAGSGKPKAEGRDRPLDRRWILKFHEDTPAIGAVPPPEIDWKDDRQKDDCALLAERMRDAYSNARYYSVRGDSCNTARNAERFLDAVGDCRNRCPDGFATSIGFRPELVRNVTVLLELGTRLCLETAPDLRPAEKSAGSDRQPEGPTGK